MSGIPRPKTWRYQRVLTEHVFDKLWLLDITLGEFRALLDGGPRSSRNRIRVTAS